MNFAFSDEQDELRRTVRRFLEERSPSAEVRRLMETPEGYDEAVWKQLGQELGLTGLAIPETYGGQGFGFVELGIVLEEMGRALLCAPFLSSACLSASAILAAGTENQKAELLPGIASGETLAALALAEPGGGWDANGIGATASPSGDGGYALEGTKSFVIDGHVAARLIVAARAPGSSGTQGVGLFVVDADADGVTRTSLATIDRTRKQARVELSGARAEALGDADAWPAVDRVLDLAAVCVAAEATGSAARCMEMAVQYAKDRVQFGRPIGSFQAVKHACAEMLLEVESARTAAYYAMWAAAEGDAELRLAAPMAKAYCTEAAFDVSKRNIQVHGGIGFTWEHDAHLYFRRAKTSELLFGEPAYHRRILADRLGI